MWLSRNLTKLWEYIFMCKENSNDITYWTILLPELPSYAILESTPERNVMSVIYVQHVHGVYKT